MPSISQPEVVAHMCAFRDEPPYVRRAYRKMAENVYGGKPALRHEIYSIRSFAHSDFVRAAFDEFVDDYLKAGPETLAGTRIAINKLCRFGHPTACVCFPQINFPGRGSKAGWLPGCHVMRFLLMSLTGLDATLRAGDEVGRRRAWRYIYRFSIDDDPAFLMMSILRLHLDKWVRDRRGTLEVDDDGFDDESRSLVHPEVLQVFVEGCDGSDDESNLLDAMAHDQRIREAEEAEELLSIAFPWDLTGGEHSGYVDIHDMDPGDVDPALQHLLEYNDEDYDIDPDDEVECPCPECETLRRADQPA